VADVGFIGGGRSNFKLKKIALRAFFQIFFGCLIWRGGSRNRTKGLFHQKHWSTYPPFFTFRQKLTKGQVEQEKWA